MAKSPGDARKGGQASRNRTSSVYRVAALVAGGAEAADNAGDVAL
jgi:hypothetical protein